MLTAAEVAIETVCVPVAGRHCATDPAAGGLNFAMARLRAVLRFALLEFGPLLVFWALLAAFGIRVAIAGSVAFILADTAWRRWRGMAFTRLYVLSSGLTVVFGTVDLLSASPFMLKYEAVVTNAATGFAFVAGARGPRPLIQEVAEQRAGQPYPDRPDIHKFFQLFTLAWALYFFIKAAFYLAVGAMLPLASAMAVRSVVGGVSLGLMVLVSTTQGRRLFALCTRLGLLPKAETA